MVLSLDEVDLLLGQPLSGETLVRLTALGPSRWEAILNDKEPGNLSLNDF